MGRRLWHGLVDASASLSRGWRSSILALAAIVSAVFVLGAFLVVSRNVDVALGRWSDAAELSIFLREDADAGQRAGLERTLREHAAVREVRSVDAEEARRRFVARFPDLAPLVALEGDTPLPASLEARLAREADVTGVMALADRLRRMPGVSDVRVDQDLLQNVLTLARVGRAVGGALSAILVLAAALAIASVVRLSYVARLDEVDVLYLLGAPLSAIRAPFVIEGALQGALGTCVALVLLAGAYAAALRTYAAVLGEVSPVFLPAWLLAALAAGGLLIGAWAGFAAVRRQPLNRT
jgi:cell division transport system permease protein